MGDYHKLKIWRRAHQLVLDVYQKTNAFPGTERYGITSQLRRAAVSIPADVAEGCGRNGDGQMAQLLRVARGSAAEVEYLLLLARDLSLLGIDDYNRLTAEADEIQRMLTALIRTVAPGPAHIS